MRYLISFHFLDLRFLITRAFGDEARSSWLQPQWLISRSNRHQVGKIGLGRPIPGRHRHVGDYRRHGTVSGGLILQTAAELERKRVAPSPRHGAFTILNREIVADDWGQVRFDLCLDAPKDDDEIKLSTIQSILDCEFYLPLDSGRSVSLADAAPSMAAIYENESYKTCLGYGDAAAASASAGTVVVAYEAPQVIALDVSTKPLDLGDFRCCYDAPGCGALFPLPFDPLPSGAPCWWLRAQTCGSCETLLNAAWNAAFGMSWLIGRLHEFAIMGSRVEEYRKRQHAGEILADSFRSAIKRRDRFFRLKFGGWMVQDVVGFAIAMINRDEASARRRLHDVYDYIENKRDAGGLAEIFTKTVNNISVYIERIEKMQPVITEINAPIIGSQLNIASCFKDVTNNIGSFAKGGEDEKAKFTALAHELKTELDKLIKDKPELAESVEAISGSVADLIEKAKGERPNKPLLQRAIQTVKDVAEGVKAFAPAVVSVAGAIATIVAKIHGFG